MCFFFLILHGFSGTNFLSIGIISSEKPSILCFATLWLAWLILPCQLFQYDPVPSLCIVFSIGVFHSRFSTALFSLFLSLWLTSFLLYGFGINASATTRCIRKLFLSFLFPKGIKQYPVLCTVGFKSLLDASP